MKEPLHSCFNIVIPLAVLRHKRKAAKTQITGKREAKQQGIQGRADQTEQSFRGEVAIENNRTSRKEESRKEKGGKHNNGKYTELTNRSRPTQPNEGEERAYRWEVFLGFGRPSICGASSSLIRSSLVSAAIFFFLLRCRGLK